MNQIKRDPVSCLLTRMAEKEGKNLTEKQIKRANKLRKSLMKRVIAEGKTIIPIDAYTWRIEH